MSTKDIVVVEKILDGGVSDCKSEYEGIMGIVVTGFYQGYRGPVSVLLIGHVNTTLEEEEVGFEINTNNEPPIQILKPIEKSVEELLDNWTESGRCGEKNYFQDKLDALNWMGYAYQKKGFDKEGEVAPLMLISSRRFIDPNKWVEISTDEFIRKVNSLTSVISTQ